MVNNTLKSPGYPNKYPGNVHCDYKISIPHGKALKVNFQEFDLEHHSSCR